MKWNWDFISGKKTEIAADLLLYQGAGAALPAKMVVINGRAFEIQSPDLSDFEVAGRVRMLMRSDWDHEAICTLARDRIVYLADQLQLARDQIAQLQNSAPLAADHSLNQETQVHQ